MFFFVFFFLTNKLELKQLTVKQDPCHDEIHSALTPHQYTKQLVKDIENQIIFAREIDVSDENERRTSVAWEFAYDLVFPVYETVLKADEERDPDDKPIHIAKIEWKRVQCVLCGAVVSSEGNNFNEHLKTHWDIMWTCSKTEWWKFHVATRLPYKKFVTNYDPLFNYDNVPRNPNYVEGNDWLQHDPNIHQRQNVNKTKSFHPKISTKGPQVPLPLHKCHSDTWADYEGGFEQKILDLMTIAMNDLGLAPYRIQQCESFGRLCQVCINIFIYNYIL